MWKVLAMFNEVMDENEEESTVVVEKTFDTYREMRNYVVTCESQGRLAVLLCAITPGIMFGIIIWMCNK